MKAILRLTFLSLTLIFGSTAFHRLSAEPVLVRHTEGLIHGFLLLRAVDGTILATGDLTQLAGGDRVTNELTFQFKDGSVHQETTVFSQRRTFRLLKYHLVQKGRTFKRPTDMTLDAVSGQVVIKYQGDDGEKTINERLKLPNDVANGIITTLMNDIDPANPKMTVSMVVSTPKPRIVKLAVSPDGEDSFTIAGATHKASRYVAKIEIGGISGVVAPIIGKQPPDTHIWMIGGKAPVLVRSEGSLCEDCPIWRIDLASPVWPNNSAVQKHP